MQKVQNIIFQFLTEISFRFNVPVKEVENEWKMFMNKDKDDKDEKDENTCVFEYTKAPNKGRICGAILKNGNVCSKHKNVMKKNALKNVRVVERSIPPVDEKPKKPLMITLNHRIDRYIHHDSGMVFFSKEDRVVFGRFDKYKQKVCELSDDDLETCLKYGFRVDKTKWELGKSL